LEEVDVEQGVRRPSLCHAQNNDLKGPKGAAMDRSKAVSAIRPKSN
jgi:hypothetical protein